MPFHTVTLTILLCMWSSESAIINPISRHFIVDSMKSFIKDSKLLPGLRQLVDFPKSRSELLAEDETTLASVILEDPGLDGRMEISTYNKFMDEIYDRMNKAIKNKNLDPMDLRLLPNTNSETKNKEPRFERYDFNMTPNESQNEADNDNVNDIMAWLFGMSSLKRTSDVSIFFYPTHRIIQCPFALGPLELRVTKMVQVGNKQKQKTAKAITETMLGYMDLKINILSGNAEITDVVFDEPGQVDIQGSIKRRANTKDVHSPFRLVLAAKSIQSLKKVARVVVAGTDKQTDST